MMMMMMMQHLCILTIALQWKLASGLSTISPIKPNVSTEWINDNVQVWESQQSQQHDNPFRVLVPPSLITTGGKGCDVTVEWSDPQKGAHDLCAMCFESDVNHNAITLVRNSLDQFKSLVELESRITGAPSQLFKARIVATRGSQGTKCPRWHYDHVPMRFIQALVGPGCDYVVSERGVDRQLFLSDDEDDDCECCDNETSIQEMVDISVADVRQGKEGEAVILKGLWEGSPGQPAVHKSPVVPFWQGRLLLTLDIVLPVEGY